MHPIRVYTYIAGGGEAVTSHGVVTKKCCVSLRGARGGVPGASGHCPRNVYIAIGPLWKQRTPNSPRASRLLDCQLRLEYAPMQRQCSSAGTRGLRANAVIDGVLGRQ